MKYGVAPLDPWGSVPSGTRRAGAVPIGEAWAAAGPGRGLGRLETAPEVFGKKLRPNRQTAVSHRYIPIFVFLLRTVQRNTQGQGPRAPPDFSEVPRRAGYIIADRGKKFIRLYNLPVAFDLTIQPGIHGGRWRLSVHPCP